MYILDDEIFATIILKSKKDGVKDDISLYEPVGSKVLFEQLQVSLKNAKRLSLY